MFKTKFSEPILQFIRTQKLVRLATVSINHQPDVVPVGFEFDGTYFWIGGHTREIFLRSYKYLNIKRGNTLVSMVMDDLESTFDVKVRGLKINGTAEIEEHDGRFGQGTYLKITPKSFRSWGILKPAY